jgi:hypothetical protein
MKKFGLPFVLMLLALSTNGCATKALWDGRFSRFHGPSAPPNLDLYRDQRHGKVLVIYDDETDEKNSRRRRAYWIDPAAEPPDNPHRPKFVPPTHGKSLALVPIGDAPRSIGWSAVTSTNAHGFTLFSEGQKLWRYELPVNQDNTGMAKQVALTPVTAAADVTVVGGVWFLYGWAQSGFAPFWR